MNILELDRVFSPPLHGVSVALGEGLHVVLGGPADGSEAFLALASGRARAREGAVRVLGADPSCSPATRARIASLEPAETLAPGRTLRDALAISLEPIGLDPLLALGPLELRGWAGRSPAALSPEERRSVALSVALARTDAALFALFEPLAGVAALDREVVFQHIVARARRVCVVVVTASVRDAIELGGHLLVLESGRLRDTTASPELGELMPGSGVELRVRCSNPRALAALLVREPAVSGVEYCVARAEHEVSARGAELDALALAVMRCARDAGVSVQAIAPRAPALELVTAASAGALRAAFERAYLVKRAAPAVTPVAAGGWADMGTGFPVREAPRTTWELTEPTRATAGQAAPDELPRDGAHPSATGRAERNGAPGTGREGEGG